MFVLVYITYLLLTKTTANIISIPKDHTFCILPFFERIFTTCDATLFMHVNNDCDPKIEKLLANETMYVFNYDIPMNDWIKYEKSVMHLFDSDFFRGDTNFSIAQKKITYQDNVIFLEEGTEVPRHILDSLFYTKAVFVVQIKLCKVMLCEYKNFEKSCTLQNFNFNAKIPSEKSFKDAVKYLGELKIKYVEIAPHVYTRNGKIVGTEIDILNTLRNKYNFTYKLFHKGNDSWYELFDRVSFSQASFVVGRIFLDEKANKAFDSSNFIVVDGLIAVFNKKYIRQKIVHRVMKNIGFIAACLISGSCIIAISYIYCLIFKKTDLRYYIYLAILPLCEQPYEFNVMRNATIRFLYTNWWLMCIVLISSYKTALIQAKIPLLDFDYTIDDLFQDGFDFETEIRTHIYIADECSRIKTSFCKEMLSRLYSEANRCNIISRIFYKKTAVIGEHNTLSNLLLESCNISSTLLNQVVFSTNRLFGMEIHYWPMLKNSLFVEPFGKIFNLLHQSGLMVNWLQKYNSYFYPTNEKIGEVEVMGMGELIMPISLLFIGCVISTVAFILEKIKYKRNLKKTRVGANDAHTYVTNVLKRLT